MLNQFEDLRNTLYKFVETRVDLLEVEVRGYIERIILKLVYSALLFVAFSIVAIFLLILLAIYLNIQLESEFAGYLIVAGFFSVVLVTLIVMKKSCMKAIRWILERTVGQDESDTTN